MMEADGARRAHWFEEVGSTNDLAKLAADAGEASGTWFIARRQSAGRGRHGRAWASPAGNFYGSLLLRTDRDLAEAGTLSLVAGLACVEAVRELSAGRLAPRLKWPNDVLLQGRKLAGILLEGGIERGRQGSWVVIGMGVNLAGSPAVPEAPTTSLARSGLPGITPEIFLAELDRALAGRLAVWQASGFAGLRQAWLDTALGIGTEVRLRIGQDERRGRFADLGIDGSILIENRLGCIERFTMGELFFEHAAAPRAPHMGTLEGS